MNSLSIPTPLGPFLVLESGGEVVASGWTRDVTELTRLLPVPVRPRRARGAHAIAERVAAYFEGELRAVDEVACRQRSGPFVEAAWEALRAVPPGEPVGYSELARRAGRPGAARAAGLACARNACALFVPCHRAVGARGALQGFRWGLERKRRLLAHERGE